MAEKYFGTDGVRGIANRGADDAATRCCKLGLAAGNLYSRGNHRHRAVIGKDTRLSGYMIEQALTAGLLSAGMDVFLFGPLPTPAVAMLTRSLRADLGVMISASHNPYHDNGIKLFGPDGYKLSDDQEPQIEALIDTDDALKFAAVRQARPRQAHRGRPGALYRIRQAHLSARICASKACASSSIPPMAAPTRSRPPLCGNSAPRSSPIGNDPNGFNINEKCGSTAPEAMCAKVHRDARRYRHRARWRCRSCRSLPMNMAISSMAISSWR